MTIDIEPKLYKDISTYCKANGIVIKEYVNELLKKQFMCDKYGERPGFIKKDIHEQDVFVPNPVEHFEEKHNDIPSIKDKFESDVVEQEVTTQEKEEEKEIIVEKPKRRKLK